MVELVGTSKESWQDAAQEAIREASQSLRQITGIDVVNQTAHVEGGKITEYRTTVNVAFVVEHHSHLIGTGVKPDEIDIHLSGNTLNVRGERKEEKEEKGKTFHRVERRSGSFARSITLPCAVNEDEVAAEYKEGVLTVTLPKSEEAKSRKIEVKH